MRGSFVALTAWVLLASGARAGVYSLKAPTLSLNYLAANMNALQERLVSYRQLEDRDPLNNPATPFYGKPTLERVEYLAYVKDLETRQEAGSLKPAEKLDLGACYIRLGRFDKAQAALKKAVDELQGDPDWLFLAELDLSAAYAADDPSKGLLTRAVHYEEKALSHWPVTHPIMTWEELHGYRRVEQLVLRHLQDRQRGDTTPTPKLRLAGVLFPGLTFEEKEKDYLAGSIRPDMWVVMPPDAPILVLQMLLWSPRDIELQWLFGELLNANGQVPDAIKVLEKVDPKGPELRSHLRRLNEYVDRFSGLFAAAQLGAAAVSAPVEPEQTDDPVTPATNPDWPPHWRSLIAGFLGGIFVAGLGALQFREWRRRPGTGDVPPISPPPEGEPAPVAVEGSPAEPTGVSEQTTP